MVARRTPQSSLPHPPPAKPPTREAKKADKRRRILAAAAALFRSQGYEATTTRAIAARAGVAAGTLFLYVRDKDEALDWVYGEDVDEAIATGTATRPRRLGFVSGVAHRLGGLYELYALHPSLALRFVRRIPTLEGDQKPAHDARNARIVATLRDEVERAIASGELRADLDVERAVRTLFGVVRVLVFSWLAAPPVLVDEGRRELRATLTLLVAGLGAGGGTQTRRGRREPATATGAAKRVAHP
jgi:TetR/AcrR family transcriptional regulator, cholesterol catabolism regulator